MSDGAVEQPSVGYATSSCPPALPPPLTASHSADQLYTTAVQADDAEDAAVNAASGSLYETASRDSHYLLAPVTDIVFSADDEAAVSSLSHRDCGDANPAVASSASSHAALAPAVIAQITSSSSEAAIALLTAQCRALWRSAHIQRRIRRPWNRDYQDCFDRVPTDLLQIEQRQRDLRALCAEFEAFARAVVELIVVQQQLPAALRVVPPAGAMGGVAGGEKFVVGHVLFKFARDWQGVYGGSDLAASKAAFAEIRSLQSVIDAEVNICDGCLSFVSSYIAFIYLFIFLFMCRFARFNCFVGRGLVWLCVCQCFCVSADQV